MQNQRTWITKGNKKLSCLGIWQLREFKRRLSRGFSSADFINPLNFQASELPYFGKSLTAFTMAEILISLTIIGIIAAITLPALQANINESAWKAQRKALYSRMSQAISLMPSLNGYGDFTGEWADDIVTPTTDTAAERFVTDGLAKVLNINNICSIPMSITNPADRQKELAKCGIPDSLTNLANSKIPFPTKLSELNPMFTSTFILSNGQGGYDCYKQPQKNINTNAAAFETKNGENIAVFYNPYCRSDIGDTSHYTQPKMCVNFIYDLNGKKGPNKVSKDIGFITALYPTDSEIIAPIPLERNAKSGNSDIMQQAISAAACKAQNNDSRLPNRDELTAMFYNKQLIGISAGMFWSGSVVSSSTAWYQHFGSGHRTVINRSGWAYVRCVKR